MERHWRHVRCTSAVSISVSVSGVPIVSYYPELELLSVPVGAELAGLYARAPVLCSGRGRFRGYAVGAAAKSPAATRSAASAAMSSAARSPIM
jgi:hypothetical protein